MLMKVLLIGLALVLVAIAFTAANTRRQPAVAIEPVDRPALVALHAPSKQAISQQANSQHAIIPKPRLAVAFRLDRELTQGLYLGERWVSPPSFSFAQPGTQYVVQAKMQSIDSRGERIDLSGDWATDDPEMIAITRRDDGEVTIVVRRPGESNLTVSAGGESKVLHVRARQVGDAMQVAITQ
jgi:hypothetical protein